jgi:hypothetical protein
VIRPDPIGGLDLVSGILLLYTVSPLPEFIGTAHAAFLIFKGAATIIRPMPMGGAPMFILGGAADLLSAAILVTGNPPLIGGEIKQLFALVLFLKGVLTAISWMG